MAMHGHAYGPNSPVQLSLCLLECCHIIIQCASSHLTKRLGIVNGLIFHRDSTVQYSALNLS